MNLISAFESKRVDTTCSFSINASIRIVRTAIRYSVLIYREDGISVMRLGRFHALPRFSAIRVTRHDLLGKVILDIALFALARFYSCGSVHNLAFAI